MNAIDSLIKGGSTLSSTRYPDLKTLDENENKEHKQSSDQTGSAIEKLDAPLKANLSASEHAKAQTSLEEIASTYGGISQVQKESKTTYQALIAPILSFFTSSTSMGARQVLSIREKSEMVDRFFEKMLCVLASLEVPNQPSLFLVYAHHNFAYGQAKAEVAKYLISKLSQLRVQLYSDQTPMAQPFSVWRPNPRKDGQLEDILTSQLCLLPTQLRSEVKPVDKVVVCCSEVLANYLDWPAYADFCLALQQAYLVDAREKGDSNIRRVVNTFCKQDGFHHVLTEMAFLHIRAEELGDQHGIIPVELTDKSYRPCLAKFIDDTTVRISDFRRFEQQAQAEQAVSTNQGRHAVIFKLIERLFITSDKALTALDKFWNEYSNFVEKLKQQSAVPSALEYFDHVEATLNEVQTALDQQPSRQRDLSLSDLRQALAQHYYHSNLSIQRVSGEIASLEDCYINLAIVEQHAQLEKEKEILKQQAAAVTRLPRNEDLQDADYSKLITLEHLFDAQKLRDGSVGFPKRILIQGRAGIGKTTLCKKLVYDYQHQASWKNYFACVLWIPLRHLKTFQCYSLEKLLSKHYFASQISAKALAQAFHPYRDKTLFILDGLDEVVGEFEDGRPLGSFLKELLNQKHVVITSRPTGVDPQRLSQLDLALETVGFTLDNVQTYIQTFVSKVNQAAIQQFIKQTPLIQKLVNIPIQLDALCYSWDSLPVPTRKQEAITVTALYQAMVEKLWHKDGSRLEKKTQDGTLLSLNDIRGLSLNQIEEQLIAAENEYLSYLAFQGLQDKRIEFDLTYLNTLTDALNKTRVKAEKLPLLLNRDLKQTSFLHTLDAHLHEQRRTYHFLHLTFQEFFAAKFIVRHLQAYAESTNNTGLTLQEDQLHAFIASHKYNRRYEIVWWMVAGLLKGQTLTQFFGQLEAAPRDLIGLRHQGVMTRCLSEARSQLNVQYIARLEDELRQWVHFETASENCQASVLVALEAFPEPLLLTFLDLFEERVKIMSAIVFRPVLSEAVISILINLLQHENKQIRERAGAILEKQKRLSDSTISTLSMWLKHENKEIREWATVILLRQQTLSDSTISALIMLLQHENEQIRDGAVEILIDQQTLSGRAISDLITLLQHENKQIILWAAIILSGQKTLSDRAISDLIILLQHENKQARKWATGILGNQQTLSDQAVSDLIDLLQHENEQIIELAARILVNQQTLSDQAVSDLINLLKHENEQIIELAARILVNQQTLSDQAISDLITLLQHENEQIIEWAAGILVNQQTLSDQAASYLTTMLNHENAWVRGVASRMLNQQKKRSDAIQPLSHATRQEENKVIISSVTESTNAPEVLSDQSMSSLIAALENENKKVRQAAADILIKQETLPDEIISALIVLLRHKNETVKEAAVSVLGQRKALPERTISDLITATQDANHAFKLAAAKVLSFHLDLLYPLLPNLASNQIEALYSLVFLAPKRQISALFIQSDHLYFYTAGNLNTVPLESDQADKMTQAFIAVQSRTQLSTQQREE